MICANCKYHLLKKYSYLPNEHLCTHPQSTYTDLISGVTVYDKCFEVRQRRSMASKYGGETYDCVLYAEKEPEPTLFELIGDFFESIRDFFKNLFIKK